MLEGILVAIFGLLIIYFYILITVLAIREKVNQAFIFIHYLFGKEYEEYRKKNSPLIFKQLRAILLIELSLVISITIMKLT